MSLLRHPPSPSAATSRWPFGRLRPLSYDLIMVDFPWQYRLYSPAGYEKAPDAHYGCMSIEEGKTLPVGALARGDCLLFMWAVWPMLPQAFDLMDAWGFRYKTGGAWHKRTKHGKTQFGTGYVLRSASEPFLIGAFGAPKTSRSERGLIETEDDFTVIDARMGRHSEKPDEAFAMAERLYPGATQRLEIFARKRRPGWEGWGNEYPEGEA